MASIYEKQGRFWLRYFDFEGNRWRDRPTEYAAPQDKKKAQLLKMETSLEEARRKGVKPGQQGRWDSWVTDYINFRYSTSPKSCQRVLIAWRMLYRFMNEKQISHPRQWIYEHNQAYVQWKAQQKKPSGKTYLHNSALRELKFLAMVMNEAKRRGYVGQSAVSVKKIPREKDRLKPALTDEQVNLIRAEFERLKSTSSDSERVGVENTAAAFEIALYTGCRMSETSIAFENIDFGRERITFVEPKGGPEVAFTHPIIFPEFVPWLRALVGRRRKEGHTTTTTITLTTSRNFGRLCDRIGIPDVTLHCLRVTFISRAYLAGYTESIVKKLVNHADDLIHAIYQRLSVDNVQEFVRNRPIAMPKPLPAQNVSAKPKPLSRVSSRQRAAALPASI